MRTLILIKHASPAVDPRLPSDQWSLSDAGRAACVPLAKALEKYRPTHVVTSDEPKAYETAREVGKILSVPVTEADDLYEHDRGNVPHMKTGEVLSAVQNFFLHPTRLVLGRETAQQAFSRLTSALDAVLASHDDAALAVVTHGTVLSLLVEAKAGVEPFGFFRRMALPSFVVFELPEWKLIDTVERVVPRDEPKRS